MCTILTSRRTKRFYRLRGEGLVIQVCIADEGIIQSYITFLLLWLQDLRKFIWLSMYLIRLMAVVLQVVLHNIIILSLSHWVSKLFQQVLWNLRLRVKTRNAVQVNLLISYVSEHFKASVDIFLSHYSLFSHVVR